MDKKEQKILSEMKKFLNPELLVEEVVNSTICIIQLLPGHGSRVEYEHDYDSEDYWNKTDLKSNLVKTKEQVYGGKGNTVMVAILDQGKMSGAGTFTGKSDDTGWLWLKKADDSKINVTDETEGSPEVLYTELGYEALDYKPITFVLSWFKKALAPYKMREAERKTKHPPFKTKKYPVGYDIKTFLFYDLYEDFPTNPGETQKDAFERILLAAPKQPWFDLVGGPDWGEHGKWYVYGKMQEPGFQIDVDAKAEIDAKYGRSAEASRKKEVDKSLGKERTRRDAFGEFNVKAAYEKWESALALVANTLSRSGEIKDDRKLSTYYVDTALKKKLMSIDPHTFEDFNPENMTEHQFDMLFGRHELIKSIISEIEDNPRNLSMESIVNDIDSILEQADKLYKKVAKEIDSSIYKCVNDHDGLTKEEITKFIDDDTVCESIDRMEKYGYIISNNGKYIAGSGYVIGGDHATS